MSKLVKTGQKWSKTVTNCQNGPKLSKIVQTYLWYGSYCVLNGPNAGEVFNSSHQEPSKTRFKTSLLRRLRADPSQCNSSHKQNPTIQQNWGVPLNLAGYSLLGALLVFAWRSEKLVQSRNRNINCFFVTANMFPAFLSPGELVFYFTM